MKLFNVIDIETSSYCNRRCTSCLRNSWPDRDAVQYLFEQRFMPQLMFKEILKQCNDLEFSGTICLCHWNEPLLDRRIGDLARMAAKTNLVCLYTNGDALTPELAKELDGVLGFIGVSLYRGSEGKKQWVQSLFKKTSVVTKGLHRVAHCNPRGVPLVDMPCRQVPRRCIITHNGTYLYCCEDLVGEFEFGAFPNLSIRDYWFGKQHIEMWETLREAGGRRKYAYCTTCPWVFGKDAAAGTSASVYLRP